MSNTVKRGFERISSWPDTSLKLPQRASAHSAGYDISSPEDVVIYPAKQHIFLTGLKAFMQPDEFLSIHIRSSLAIKLNLRVVNCTGIIDSDYCNNPDNEGHIIVCLRNEGSSPVSIEKGNKIAQGIFQKYLTTDGDEQAAGRTGGIGSSGV